MQIILHNPIHTLETTTTGCHAEAQTTCDLEENHDPGRISCFPLDRAAIREPARGMSWPHLRGLKHDRTRSLAQKVRENPCIEGGIQTCTPIDSPDRKLGCSASPQSPTLELIPWLKQPSSATASTTMQGLLSCAPSRESHVCVTQLIILRNSAPEAQAQRQPNLAIKDKTRRSRRHVSDLRAKRHK